MGQHVSGSHKLIWGWGCHKGVCAEERTLPRCRLGGVQEGCPEEAPLSQPRCAGA